MINKSRRQLYEMLRSQMEQDRGSFMPHWRELADFGLPRRHRAFSGDNNKGDRRNQKIVDGTATQAIKVLRSGMMSGVTSPARPWFRLTTPDPDLAEFGRVKEYLHLVSQRMTTVFLQSNLYKTLPIWYGDGGQFGTGAFFLDEDLNGKVFRTYPMTLGSYSIANNHRLEVDTFSRTIRMTVRQVVMKFGMKDESTGKPDWSNISTFIRNLWDSGQYESWVDVVHLIKPNENYDPKKLHSKYKKFLSCYYESGTGSAANANYLGGDRYEDKFLQERGYDYFPVLPFRWETSGEDVWGTDCPGMTGLGDVKALQTMQKRKSEAIEKFVRPPMKGPATLRGQKSSILPGDMTYVNELDGNKGFGPVFQVDPRIQELMLDIQDHQRRINEIYMVPLFMMLANDRRANITAREIEARYEEKLLMVGPVLEQVNEQLDQLIDISFMLMERQGLLPEAPEELQGMNLKVEYISAMAQAQKSISLGGMERLANFVGGVVAQTGDTSILDKIDTDQMVDEYGDAAGVSPRIIRSDEKVDEIRAARAQQAQAQAQASMIKEGAGAARDLSQADMEGDNALTRLLKGAGQASSAQ